MWAIRASVLALRITATALGSHGVFCLYAVIMTGKPTLAVHAAVMLLMASAITIALNNN